MLISMKPILDDATKRGYGVVAPNIFDGYTIEAAFLAALELRAPMVLDTNGEFACLQYLAEISSYYSNKYPEIPVALNLDHGHDYDNVMQAIHAGFTSVMIDRSSAPFEENVRETAEVVRAAHAVGIAVEAELGHVGRGRDYEAERDDNLTRAEDVVRFVEQTGVDCLAVAVGTAHGHYAGTPHIDFARLDEIRASTGIPLVLHGGSSTGDETLRQAIRHGVSKVNIGTDLGDAGIAAINEFLADYDPHRRGVIEYVYQAGARGFGEKMRHYMELFGERGRW